MNFKVATIQYRFRPKKIVSYYKVDNKYKDTEASLKNLALKFIKLLSQIKGNGVSYEAELERIVVNPAEYKKNIIQITDLKSITQKLFTTIHSLSEQEIHFYPRFLKFITNLTQEMCTVLKKLTFWASGFYEELRLNYLQLDDELTLLIPEPQIEKINVRKQQSLEGELREW